MNNLSHMFHCFTAEAPACVTVRIDLQSSKSVLPLKYFGPFSSCISFFLLLFLLQKLVSPTDGMDEKITLDLLIQIRTRFLFLLKPKT